MKSKRTHCKHGNRIGHCRSCKLARMIIAQKNAARVRKIQEWNETGMFELLYGKKGE